MIQVEDLRKTYRIGFWRKSVEALRGVSFEVKPGDLYGFIGPNGAGKSTTIKILLGLLKAGSGRASLMGSPAGSPRSRLEVGFLPEQPYFYDYLSGREFLRFYGQLSGLKWGELKKRVAEVSELAGVRRDAMDRKLRTYSKGMLQRIGLAQVLLSRPRLVILDEPMSGLDPLGRRDVRTLLQNLHAQGITVFYSSHVLSDVEAICTRLAMVVNGQIRREGTVAQVLEGEAEHYQVVLSSEIKPGDVPRGAGTALDARTVSCQDLDSQRALLQWALAQGLGVLSVSRNRHTLEDVLAEEVAKGA
ncbi:MAG TPA: ABC transporter ATP-binding protein [Fibrobacteria bacterium]|nr:ABC transporter ATP-binding protein [Fibrobacteria bacterium]